MKSRPISPGQNILASQNNDKRDDARGGSFLFAHQQLGVLALGTGPSNNQVISIVINGTTITITAVTGSPTNPNDVKAPGTAAGFVANLIQFLRRPDLTSSTQVAASAANQTLLSYVGWAWPGSSTNIVPFSLNKNVNGLTGLLTSFNITGITVTSGTWTAQTMQLYVEDGTYYIGTTRVLFTGGSTPTVTAPASHPRIDVLTADSSGTLAWTVGSENVSPVAPAYPAGKVPICELYNVVSETALYDNENQQTSEGYILNDVRPFSTPVYIGSTAQVAGGLFIPDPGSEAQGDILYYNGASWVRLPAGTTGQVLTTEGGSANPNWTNPATAFHGAGTANGANYTSNSASYTDVDGTNLKITLTGLTVGGFLYFRVYARAFWFGSGTKTNGLALRDTSNAAIIASLNLIGAEQALDTQFIYKIQSATMTISLQYISDGSNNAEVYNQAHFDTASQAAPWFYVLPLS